MKVLLDALIPFSLIHETIIPFSLIRETFSLNPFSLIHETWHNKFLTSISSIQIILPSKSVSKYYTFFKMI